MTILAYAAQSATSPLAPFQIPRREANADDVVIDILYCGVCHSDLHTARNDWKNTLYPVVPGPEIIGRVRSVGAGVTRFKPGRSAERRVGKECVSKCRSRGSPYH